MSRRSGVWVLVAAAVVVGGLGACREAPPPRPPAFRSVVSPFDPAVPRLPDPARGLALSSPDLREMDALVDELAATPEALARDGGNRDLLYQLEAYFPRLGRLDDLMTLYRDAIAAVGDESEAGAMLRGRLAVLYTLLGHRAEARVLVGEAEGTGGEAGGGEGVDLQFARAYWLATEEGRSAEAAALLSGLRGQSPDYPGTGLVTRAEVERLLEP